MPNDPILHLLGLARKAGRLEVGEEPVGAACRARHAKLVLVADNAAPNTFRRAAHFGEAGNVLWLPLPRSKEELGFALGRSTCAIAALTDVGMAAALAGRLAALDPERYGPAAQQLELRAEKALQRQREQLQHEKNLLKGKKKPWAPPPRETPPPSRRAEGGRGRTGAPAQAGSSARTPRGERPALHEPKPPRKPGPGGRSLQGPAPGPRPKRKP